MEFKVVLSQKCVIGNQSSMIIVPAIIIAVITSMTNTSVIVNRRTLRQSPLSLMTRERSSVANMIIYVIIAAMSANPMSVNPIANSSIIFTHLATRNGFKLIKTTPLAGND